MIKNKDLKRRILEISYPRKLSHLGSCLTAVDIIDEIYSKKKPDEKFVLSSGHAGLALYVVIEKYLPQYDAEKMFDRCGVHPERSIRDDGTDGPIFCSTGSLGQGISIACGMAIANRDRKVYTLLSDGEMNEGSCYEALEVAHEQNLSNLVIYINCNNWGAYKALSRDHIVERCKAFTNLNIIFRSTNTNDFPFLEGQKGHYISLDKQTYELALRATQ